VRFIDFASGFLSVIFHSCFFLGFFSVIDSKVRCFLFVSFAVHLHARIRINLHGRDSVVICLWPVGIGQYACRYLLLLVSSRSCIRTDFHWDCDWDCLVCPFLFGLLGEMGACAWTK